MGRAELILSKFDHVQIMEKNKTPVILVFVALLALIVASIAALIVLKKGNNSKESASKSEREEVVVDFELSKLAEKAKRLVNNELAEALRQGDVPIDFMSTLRKDIEDADKALSSGNLKKARSRYTEIVSTAESKLETLESAKSARALRESIYTELKNAEYLKTAFENTYTEAVDNYNQGLQDLESGAFKESILLFEKTRQILEELQKQSAQQLEAKLEAAEAALAKFDPATARTSFERVLEIDASNAAAQQGLQEVEALEAIVQEMHSIKSLQESDGAEAALKKINELIEENPGNSFLLNERTKIETVLAEAKRDAIIERADAAEAKGELAAAITALEEANQIRSDEKTQKRIQKLKSEEKKRHLEVLLETGYNALKAGNFKAAKTAYDDALKLDPNSKEAHEGLKKTSSLYLASIRYDKSIESAEKYLSEGRIPLSTKFFNEALESRPSILSFKQKDKEVMIREELAAQREPVSVTVVSDGKTYVSLIGVFAPERFKKKEIMLYPDVYTFKGTRSRHMPVEFERKVSKSMKPGGIQVICVNRL